MNTNLRVSITPSLLTLWSDFLTGALAKIICLVTVFPLVVTVKVMFAVIYRFKVKPGMESKFERAWALMTHEFRDTHGGLGSCLHQDDKGYFIAYARWPNREMWEKDKEIVNLNAMSEMSNAVEEFFAATPLNVKNDLLVR